jgi:hypothetical protein
MKKLALTWSHDRYTDKQDTFENDLGDKLEVALLFFYIFFIELASCHAWFLNSSILDRENEREVLDIPIT